MVQVGRKKREILYREREIFHTWHPLKFFFQRERKACSFQREKKKRDIHSNREKRERERERSLLHGKYTI
jgi:hypothetical protein